jgi:2-methylcitrate dehydratase PrpD
LFKKGGEMAQDSITRKWVEFLSKATFDDMPSEVVHQTKMFILDNIGCALGGYALNPGKDVTALGRDMNGKPEATVIGSGDKLNCASAAYVNGKLANLLDMDEVLYGCNHIGSTPVFPALNVGERVEAAGKDIILSVALGYDFAARSALSAPQFLSDAKLGVVVSDYQTLAFNTLAATVAASKILKLDKAQIVNALTCAAHFAPGAIASKFAYTPPANFEKYGDMGWFCFSGVMAALCARHSYTGDPSVLDGPYGLAKLLGALTFDADTFVGDLGKRWYIMDAGIKPYPCCRFFHTGIRLFEDIVTEQELEPNDIDKVIVNAHPGTALPTWLAADNWADSPHKDLWFSQFSFSFALACVAHHITPGPLWGHNDTLTDPSIAQLTRKVVRTIHPDALKQMAKWTGHPGRLMSEPLTSLSVVTNKGTFTAESSDLPGDSWNLGAKLSDEHLIAKFRNNSRHVLIETQIDGIIEAVSSLDTVADPIALTKLLARESS